MNNNEIRSQYEKETGKPFQRSPIVPLPGMPPSYWRLMIGIIVIAAIVCVAAVTLGG